MQPTKLFDGTNWVEFAGGPVVARAYLNTTVFSDLTTPVDFGGIDFETTPTITTGAAWKFTAPSAGYYSLSVTLLPPAGSISVALFKNGAVYSPSPWICSPSVSIGYVSGETTVQLAAGDYIDVRADAAGINFTDGNISIFKIG